MRFPADARRPQVCELDLIFNFQKAYAVSPCSREISRSHGWLTCASGPLDLGRAHHSRRATRIIQESRPESREFFPSAFIHNIDYLNSCLFALLQVAQSDAIEESEVQEDTLARLGSLAGR